MASSDLWMIAVIVIGAPACASDPRAQSSDAAAASVAPAMDAARATEAVLIDHAAWQPLDLALDPFWDPERDYRPCGLPDWFIEGEVEPYLELQTGACNYATLVQPSLVDVERGDVIALALSHTSLNGTDAMGHAAIMLGSTELWSRTVPIRAQPESHNIEWTAPAAFPAGTQIAFHVENHGDNSWRLLRLAREAR